MRMERSGPLLEALLQPPGDPLELRRPVLALVAEDHIEQARDEGLGIGRPFPELLAQIEGGPDATGAREESDQGQAVLEAILLGGEFLEQPLGELESGRIPPPAWRASAGRRAEDLGRSAPASISSTALLISFLAL